MSELPKIRYRQPKRSVNHMFWQKKKGEYPYHVLALTGKPAPHKHEKGIADFICIPVGDGTSLWGFKDDVDAALFHLKYGVEQR